jgi:hypothetical protein
MKLFNSIRAIWDNDRQAGATTNQPTAAGEHRNSAEVLPFPTRATATGTISAEYGCQIETPEPSPRKFHGMLDMPEIEAFLSGTHFGLGRHNGACLRTTEALNREVRTITVRFQGLLLEQIERKRTHISRMRLESLRTAGLSEQVTARLTMAAEQLEDEISRLNSQIAAAEKGEGWVRAAIELYRTGFLKGMQEALEFELLGY